MTEGNVMQNENRIQLTGDGSHTIAISPKNITYHSKHGAIQESRHVFIDTGLNYFIQNRKQHNETINIFEMGFGTGLNALLSLEYAIEHDQKIFYKTIEPHAITIHEAFKLNYAALIDEKIQNSFNAMHESEWDKETEIHPLFSFRKMKASLQQFETKQKFHVIYFDAFDPNAQPELWTEIVFKKIFDMLYPNGILTTYCSKGVVQKAMKAAGFTIEKLKGPPGKREIVRALCSV